jgi:hypothetical protein
MWVAVEVRYQVGRELLDKRLCIKLRYAQDMLVAESTLIPTARQIGNQATYRGPSVVHVGLALELRVLAISEVLYIIGLHVLRIDVGRRRCCEICLIIMIAV